MDSAASKFIRTLVGEKKKRKERKEKKRVVIRASGFEFKGKELVGERKPMEISSGGK